MDFLMDLIILAILIAIVFLMDQRPPPSYP